MSSFKSVKFTVRLSTRFLKALYCSGVGSKGDSITGALKVHSHTLKIISGSLDKGLVVKVSFSKFITEYLL